MPARRSRPRLLGALASTALAVTALGAATATATATPAPTATYTVTSLHFAVMVGPNRDQACDVVGDVYRPNSASPTSRVPAILTTNGFGGSAADQGPFAVQYAKRGYLVLSYSGLGFGGSGCKITLDDPDYDGVAARQLVSYLGGAPDVAFLDADHTQPAPRLDVVVIDTTDHAGHTGAADRYDPRVGMWGGSYGGQIQFAAASVDARIDTLVPQITWNDLSYSLDPNNAAPQNGVSTRTPGATKSTWALAFTAEGIFDGVQYAQNDPSRDIGCPNFADFVCPALVFGGTTGYLQPADVNSLRHASVSNYYSRIRIPVLLDQGQVDTLFNLNEAVATYRALNARNVPVQMMWREQGHSGGKPTAAGLAYERTRIQNWFDHYLLGRSTSLGPKFAYYQDWTGTWAQASGYPVGAPRSLYLSGGQSLVGASGDITSDTQAFTTIPAGGPSGLSGLDVVGGISPVPPAPDVNLPGAYSVWTSAALASSMTVVGSPQLTVQVSAPTAGSASTTGPAGELVLFAKVYDVAEDGTASLINGLVAPIRVADPTRPIRVTLPGIAHLFPAGDSIRIVLAGGDPNYRGGVAAVPVTVTTGSATQVLTLPTL